ncbi:MAG: YARHG domain-containing protein [Reichenbachiella sp.]
MRNITQMITVLFAVLIFSCSNKKEGTKGIILGADTTVVKETVKEQTPLDVEKNARLMGPKKTAAQTLVDNDIKNIDESLNPLYGYWVGMFGKNKINIAISNIESDSIFGYSVCAGNYRKITGTIKSTTPQVYTVVMYEPGDDKYDGKFEFTIDEVKKQLKGKWASYKNTVGAKEYSLEKKDFKYNTLIGEFPEASINWLEPMQVENFNTEEIELYRNMIYARHGYSFTNLKIRRIFDQLDWYIPMSTDIREDLTDREVQNIDMMYNYEDYYEEYYNDFGR